MGVALALADVYVCTCILKFEIVSDLLLFTKLLCIYYMKPPYCVKTSSVQIVT